MSTSVATAITAVATGTSTGSATVVFVTVTATPPATYPIYFETGWGVLSMVNLLLTLIAILVIGIVGLNRLSFIPAFISSVSTLANGLCYYAWYTGYSATAQRAAAGVANVCWGMQEIGTPFYSYFILKKILSGKSSRVFMYIFWSSFVIQVGIRSTIAAFSTIATANPDFAQDTMVTRLHNAYFSVLAATETVSSFFLLRTFYKAGRRSKSIGGTTPLFHHLARSTEIRLATLALIGIMRACTFSFASAQTSGQIIATQLDRMAAIMTNVFPVVMMVDLLSARISHATSHLFGSYMPDSYKRSDDNDVETGKSGKSSKRQSRLPTGLGSNALDTIARDFSEYMGPGLRNGNGSEKTDSPPLESVRKGSIGSYYETQGGGQTMKISPVAYSLGTLPDIKEFPYTKTTQKVPTP